MLPPGALVPIHPIGFLVITDTDLSATAFAPGTFGILVLQVGGNTVLESSTIADSNGTASRSEHLTSGIVVSVLPTCFGPSTFGVIRGYLIPAS